MSAATKPTPDDAVEDPNEPLLELSTLAPKRPTITIDGEMFELKVLGDFGIEEQQRIHREGADYQDLWNRSDLNKAGQKRMKMLLEHLFAKVLDAPPEVKNKLNDEQKAQVVLTFMVAPLQRAMARLEEERACSTSEN